MLPTALPDRKLLAQMQKSCYLIFVRFFHKNGGLIITETCPTVNRFLQIFSGKFPFFFAISRYAAISSQNVYKKGVAIREKVCYNKME